MIDIVSVRLSTSLKIQLFLPIAGGILGPQVETARGALLYSSLLVRIQGFTHAENMHDSFKNVWK